MDRQLRDLRGIGKEMLEDFDQLGIKSVNQLKSRDADRLYLRMCELRRVSGRTSVRSRHVPACFFAIEQARNPSLPDEQKDWWYWSRVRKAGAARSSATR